jgi:hypothetical protein
MIHEDRNVAATQKVNLGQDIFQLPPTIRRIVRRIESYIYIQILLKETAAFALMIFFDKDSILLTVGGRWKIT